MTTAETFAEDVALVDRWRRHGRAVACSVAAPLPRQQAGGPRRVRAHRGRHRRPARAARRAPRSRRPGPAPPLAATGHGWPSARHRPVRPRRTQPVDLRRTRVAARGSRGGRRGRAARRAAGDARGLGVPPNGRRAQLVQRRADERAGADPRPDDRCRARPGQPDERDARGRHRHCPAVLPGGPRGDAGRPQRDLHRGVPGHRLQAVPHPRAATCSRTPSRRWSSR